MSTGAAENGWQHGAQAEGLVLKSHEIQWDTRLFCKFPGVLLKDRHAEINTIRSKLITPFPFGDSHPGVFRTATARVAGLANQWQHAAVHLSSVRLIAE